MSSCEYHQDQLQRVCAHSFKVKAYRYPCSKFSSELRDAFGISVGADLPEIHPPQFCNTCYAKMKQYIVSGCVNSALFPG